MTNVEQFKYTPARIVCSNTLVPRRDVCSNTYHAAQREALQRVQFMSKQHDSKQMRRARRAQRQARRITRSS